MYEIEDVEYGCAIEALSNMLGKKWVGAIIWNVNSGKKRFGELERSLNGCSKKMLIQQLELLINQGIMINDKKREENKVESVYYLSNSGLSLLPMIKNMIEWSDINIKCDKR